MQFRVEETIKRWRHSGPSLDRDDFSSGCCAVMNDRVRHNQIKIELSTMQSAQKGQQVPRLMLDKLGIDFCPKCGQRIHFETEAEYQKRLLEHEIRERDIKWMEVIFGKESAKKILKERGNRELTPKEVQKKSDSLGFFRFCRGGSECGYKNDGDYHCYCKQWGPNPK